MGCLPPFSTSTGFRNHPQYVSHQPLSRFREQIGKIEHVEITDLDKNASSFQLQILRNL